MKNCENSWLFDGCKATLSKFLNECFLRGIDFKVNWQYGRNDTAIVVTYNTPISWLWKYQNYSLSTLKFTDYETKKKQKTRP